MTVGLPLKMQEMSRGINLNFAILRRRNQDMDRGPIPKVFVSL